MREGVRDGAKWSEQAKSNRDWHRWCQGASECRALPRFLLLSGGSCGCGVGQEEGVVDRRYPRARDNSRSDSFVVPPLRFCVGWSAGNLKRF